MPRKRNSKNKTRQAAERASTALSASEALIRQLEQTLNRERTSQTLETLRAAQLQPTTSALLLQLLNDEQQIIKDIKAVAERLKREAMELDPNVIMSEQFLSLGRISVSDLLKDAGTMSRNRFT
mgnify:CR=1 FL=1